MKPFRVSGRFWMGRVHTPFTVETVGVDEDAARHRVYSTIGSQHRVDRHHVTIEKVEPIGAEDVTDAVVEKRLSMVK